MLSKGRKNKIRKLLARLNPSDKPELLIDSLKDDIAEVANKDTGVSDIRRSLMILQQNVLNKLEDLPDRASLNELKKNYLDTINDVEDELRKLIKEQAREIVKLDNKLSEEKPDELTPLKDDLEELRKLILSHGGGAQNRQIKVNGVDVLKTYTDINFIGSISVANNSVKKNVDFTFSGSGGSPGGNVNTFQFNLDGINFDGSDFLFIDSGTGKVAADSNWFGIKNIDNNTNLLFDTSRLTRDRTWGVQDLDGTVALLGGLNNVSEFINDAGYITGASFATPQLDNLSAVAINASLLPGTSGAVDLGSSSKMWGNTFLKSGGVINFNNGNFTLTHSSGLLTTSGDVQFGGTASHGLLVDTGWFFGTGVWLDMGLGGPSGIGSGGAGTNPWIAYAANTTNWFSDSAVGDICYRNTSTALLFGNTSGQSGMSLLNDRLGMGIHTATAVIHIKAGTTAASTAPLKFTSGSLLTSAEAGAVEFLTDAYYVTTTTNAKRRMIVAGTTGRSTAQTAAVASVATYTLGAADASYQVSMNVLVTTSTLHNFTCELAYTDEGNTARVVTLQFSTLAGAFVTAITNAQGAVPYEGVPLHIRCKASTSITLRTQAAGTFTTVTYNVEGVISQIA